MGWFVTHLSCPRCRRTYDPHRPQNTCGCGSPLLVDYDLPAVAGAVSPSRFRGRPSTMWRYEELLPLRDPGSAISLGEGMTPLVSAPRLGGLVGLPRMAVKDDGLNPTGSFKARGASCGASRARELGVTDVALPTAGNAGGAWAAYGAAGGLRVHVAMPRDAPAANRAECLLYGADVHVVDGLIDDAARHVRAHATDHGWFDVATLREPYRVEGKKTLAFEIAEQGGWVLPDAVVYPAGGGVGLIGMWRGFGQLVELGWAPGPVPRLFVVQADGCAPLVRAFAEGASTTRPWGGAATMAAGLRVPDPLGGELVLRAVRETGGGAVEVSESDLLAGMRLLGTEAGISAAPEGGAAVAGAARLLREGSLGAGERVVVVNTGSALKYPEAMSAALRSAGHPSAAADGPSPGLPGSTTGNKAPSSPEARG